MSRRATWHLTNLILGSAGLVLLIVIVRQIEFPAIYRTLKSLQIWQISTLFFVNLLVLTTFGARWWLLVRAMGSRVPLFQIILYRLAAFGVNYFTPGPQFGGEPLQVGLLNKREGVPAVAGTASVTIDKLLELMINLGFLVWGLMMILSRGLMHEIAQPNLLGIAFILFAVPVLYLLGLALGTPPLTVVLSKMPQFVSQRKYIQSLKKFVEASESQAINLIQKKPGIFLGAVSLSIAGWVFMFLEFWLSMYFVGMPANLLQVFALMTIARIAFLAPTPGGLGALEAALAFSAAALGSSPVVGLSLVLLIRARDISLGLFGLFIIGKLLPELRKGGSSKKQKGLMV